MPRLLFKSGEAQKATMLVRPLLRTRTPVVASSTSTQCCSSKRSSAARASFSSLPHHLARKNNGMVNVFVKSTKVPRPPVVTPAVGKPKLKNQLKQGWQGNLIDRNAIRMNDDTVQNSSSQQPHFSYAGNENIPITSKLKIVLPGDDVPRGIWPAFRMMVSMMSSLLHVVAWC